ncbi:KOW domain-containing RNA-binding protein [Flavonifractor hominis]|uniref:KOW domain-containing RNA-binding protein n=1 Tax=Flavonifractor hominis TaxID=3133178 RepID=A0ABV1EMZ9_9FIRM
MADAVARIVRSLAGHDRGELFCVLETQGAYLLLCDGKRRKLASPKRKKAVHTAPVGEFRHPVLDRIQAGDRISNQDIRRALAAFRVEELRRV